jgi:hypothetical protein
MAIGGVMSGIEEVRETMTRDQWGLSCPSARLIEKKDVCLEIEDTAANGTRRSFDLPLLPYVTGSLIICMQASRRTLPQCSERIDPTDSSKSHETCL